MINILEIFSPGSGLETGVSALGVGTLPLALHILNTGQNYNFLLLQGTKEEGNKLVAVIHLGVTTGDPVSNPNQGENFPLKHHKKKFLPV